MFEALRVWRMKMRRDPSPRDAPDAASAAPKCSAMPIGHLQLWGCHQRGQRLLQVLPSSVFLFLALWGSSDFCSVISSLPGTFHSPLAAAALVPALQTALPPHISHCALPKALLQNPGAFHPPAAACRGLWFVLRSLIPSPARLRHRDTSAVP